jgi:DNA mismatch endonuclease (patch repair protein)
MADKFDKETRSRVMSSVKGSGTKMELACRPVLESLGFEYHPKGVFGNPDFAHMDKMVAVFLDGCLWHLCPEHCKMPGDNAEFWRKKLERNRARDKAVTEMLEGSGWRVIRVWEHDLKALVKALVSKTKGVNYHDEKLHDSLTGDPDKYAFDNT